MTVTASRLCFSYRRTVISDVNLVLAPGKLHILLGPNGCGKSTLLSLLAGDMKPHSGTIDYDGRSLGKIPSYELAKKRAYLMQKSVPWISMPNVQLVQLGRIPYAETESRKKTEDIADEVMAYLHLEDLKHKDFNQISGGEQQRIQFARVLTQIWDSMPCFLLLDEPSANLDVKHQIFLLEMTRKLAIRGASVIIALHDLHLAAQYGDRIVFIKDGRIAQARSARQVFSREVLEYIYEIPFIVQNHPRTGRPFPVAEYGEIAASV